MSPKELNLEDIRRSCLNCGNKHYNHKPCCDDVLCVSDIMREVGRLKQYIEKLKAELSNVIVWIEKQEEAQPKTTIVGLSQTKQAVEDILK